MNKNNRRMSKKLGLQPGSVIYVGAERTEQVQIHLIEYSESEYTVKSNITEDEAAASIDKPSMSWINVDGIHDSALVERLGEKFGIHPLDLEDIVNTGQRPKIDDSKDYIFLAMKMLYEIPETDEIRSEQVSVLFGRKWVITFQETGEDVFEPVRNRIIKRVPRVRLMTSDYLAYSLVDAVVDHYFVLLERIGERLDILDDQVSENAKPTHLDSIRKLKKQLISIRKAVWPMREVIGVLERSESDLIAESTGPYIRDLYEHVIQVIDTVEAYRDMTSSLLDLYHTGISNRMNEIMKVLTIFASVFIPLGFLAGVYGMNFDTSASPFNLPELGFKYGYIMFWCLALLIGGGLLWFFRRRKWL